MTKTYRISVLPGDGIGRDVVPEAVRVLEEVQRHVGGFQIELHQFECGGEYYLQEGREWSVEAEDFTKKEADAEALVWRANFMYESQRTWLKPKSTYRAGKGGRLTFPENKSWIIGLPGGTGAGDQLRSKNPSRYFLDEGAFVDEFEDCRTNSEACCQDIKIVSTANPGEFAALVHDRLGE